MGASRSRETLVVVVGPSAAGKSGLAVRLAAVLDREVLSADSQQVYRRFDIGTGKLTSSEQQGIPHHLLDVVDPDVPFSAARFVELADAVIADAHRRERGLVVAGGSGLYVKALLRGLFQAPPPDEGLREEHRRIFAQNPAALHEELAAVDPLAAARLEVNDLVRVSRALEIYQQTGRTISKLQQEHAFAEARYPAVLLGLSPPREKLRARIEARVDSMMARGWLEEVRGLMAAGLAECRPMGALGYRQLRAHLRGELDLTEAVRQTKRDTWRFARRQVNWFSADTDISWHEEADDVDAARLVELLDAAAGQC